MGGGIGADGDVPVSAVNQAAATNSAESTACGSQPGGAGYAQKTRQTAVYMGMMTYVPSTVHQRLFIFLHFYPHLFVRTGKADGSVPSQSYETNLFLRQYRIMRQEKRQYQKSAS